MALHKRTMPCTVVAAFAIVLAIPIVAASYYPSGRVPQPRKCGPNEVWKECVSPECAEQTCPPKKVDACTSLCTFDCYCADGFARDRRGICISVQDCLSGGPRRPPFRPFQPDLRGRPRLPPRPPTRPGHPFGYSY